MLGNVKLILILIKQSSNKVSCDKLNKISKYFTDKHIPLKKRNIRRNQIGTGVHLRPHTVQISLEKTFWPTSMLKK